MGRPPLSEKLNMKKGLWTEEEDAKILAYVSKHGTGNWTDVPRRAGLKRCGKSCRLRWTNYLRPDLKHESFTPQEEELIIRFHSAIGSRWSIIAQQLPGRTDNDVKNYWNTKLRKKLTEMGIDPVTHKPFSQILADYGNINGLPKTKTQIGSLNKELKSYFMVKSEPDSVQSGGTSNDVKNQPMDLLVQLQAIQMVKDASINCTSFEASSSSATKTISTNFNWQDFLLEDVFHAQEEEEEKGTLNERQHLQEMKFDGFNIMDYSIFRNGFEASSSSESSSFVEGMIDREDKMFLDFPGLLDEPFYC